MLRYVIRRVLWTVPVLWAIVTLTFFLLRFAPGGPFDADRSLPPEVERNIRVKYRLDSPLGTQYWHYLSSLARGDLGPSMSHPDRTVGEMLGEAFPVSLLLGLCAMAIALAVGVSAGAVSALKPNSARDYLAMTVAVVGLSVPNFVLAPLLVLLFSELLGLLPVAGWGTLRHLILPALALGAAHSARIARLARAGMLEVMSQDFIRTARAKGLSEWTVVVRHALRGGLLPVLSYLGPACAGVLTGSVVIEYVFNIPGLGNYFISAPMARDYPLALGTVIFYSVLLVLFNAVVDVLYAWLDPRVKLE